MRRGEAGFTLLEILVSLAIFSIIVVGALGILGAANTGGFLEGFPNAFATARVARDYTAASVYLQAFQEFVASKGSAAATPGAYCVGSGCSPAVSLPGGLAGYPTPQGTPEGLGYQLDWTRLDVVIQTWYWDQVTKKYTTAVTADETMVRVQSTLTWRLLGGSRSSTASRSITVDRFIPNSP